jgi:hypothetical protein
MPKLALVCKICHEITWLKIDNLVIKTDRRYHICDICSLIEAESNVQLPLQQQLPQQQRTLQDF